jgi:ABC-2 type transport system ATP-binding protein
MATLALSLRGLGKDYGTRTAVGAVDLDVARGELVGLLGPNGAGKTTTISMVCGVLAPTRGSVAIAGIELRADPFAAKAKLGYAPQDLALYEDLSALQNLRYFGSLYGLRGALRDERITWALDVVGLRDRARDQVKQYSGGMKRRLNLAAALLHRPEVLILDEPTVGVDPQSRNHLFETIRTLHADGTTIIYTSHYLEEVEALCDRVAIMDRGAIIASGAPAELARAHAETALEIELAGEPAAIDDAATRAAAHAAVERDGATLRVTPRDGLAPMVAAIEAANVTIVQIASRRATLESAFLALTGRALRDEA